LSNRRRPEWGAFFLAAIVGVLYVDTLLVFLVLVGALLLKALPFVLAAAVLWLLFKLVALVFRGLGAVFSWFTDI
jgi:hypothetical protein